MPFHAPEGQLGAEEGHEVRLDSGVARGAGYAGGENRGEEGPGVDVEVGAARGDGAERSVGEGRVGDGELQQQEKGQEEGYCHPAVSPRWHCEV